MPDYAPPPNDSAPSSTAGIFSSLANPDGTVGGVTDLATPGTLIPSETGGQAKVSAGTAAGSQQNVSLARLASPGLASAETVLVAENTPPTTLTSAGGQLASGNALREVAPVSAWSGSPSEPVATEPTLLAANLPPSSLSTTSTPPAPSAALPEAGSVSQGNASRADGLEIGAGPAVAPAAQTAPVLLVSANSGAAVRVPATAGANQTSQPNSSNAIVPDVAGQTDSSAETATANPLAGIVNGAVSALPGLNAAAQLTPGKTALRFVAPRVTAAVFSPSARGAGSGAPSSILPSTLPTTSASGNGSGVGSETPFSVFFSDPGPGTESAASALPKMILPVTNSAIRDSHSVGVDAPSVSSPSVGSHSGVTPSGTSQNPAPPNPGDPAGSQSGSLPTGQAQHRDADASAVSTPVAPSPAGAVSSPAGSTSPGTTLPLVPQAAPVADTSPKPSPPPATAAGNLATPLPAAAENPAVAAAGPVQAAQLVNRIGQSEMRIGMNTSAFGSVEVRTVIHASDVGLVIGSEKGDLRGLLANEMPAITNTLQQQNLRLSSVNFMPGFASSNHSSGGGDSQQRSFTPAPASSSSVSSETAADDPMEIPAAGVYGGGGGSLSILA
jgi:hypothetical protein